MSSWKYKTTNLILVCSLFFVFTFISVHAQSIVINEVMSSNANTLFDEDNDTPDWIELFNSSPNTINLSGYSISDNENEPGKWIFPELSFESGEFLTIFASGKDRKSNIKHWETIINWGNQWKYRIGDSEPPSAWKDISFNDASWQIGNTSIGYGDEDDYTIIDQTISLYLRKTFSIDDTSQIITGVLHVDFDDAFIAYLNGFEIARSNIGSAGDFTPFNQSANEPREALIYQGGKPVRFDLNQFKDLIQEGENVLSIQVHNYGITSSDLTIIPFLTLGLHSIPSPTNGVPEILEFSLPSLHTNFQLSADGEELTVSDASGNLLDSLILPALSPDISFGRKPDGNSEFYYFSESTPGEPNVTEGFAGVSVPPLFSIDGGFYNEPIFITIDNPALNGDIYITTNGAPPDISSEVYAGPIPISESKVIRARIIEDGNLPSEIVTNSYFIDFETTLPVVSLSTEPGNFFDDEYGIYVMGDSAEPGFPYFGANFWKDWERPIHFEIYENNGERAFKSDGGVKIYGAYSRGLPQKSLALFARGEYGYKEFDHQLFPNMPINSFQSFVLRNSGNDWEFTLFRDAMMQSLVDDIDLENLASRTAVVFLNGAYWGIHNIREKANEEYLASHNNIDADNIDLLENNGFVLEGDGEKYWELISYLETHNAAIDENYEYVKSLMDVDNFIDYELTEIFIDNQDWPGNNIKYWREKSGEGKWRWVLYDTDFGFGIFNPYAYENNTLEFALEPNGPEWPNPPWSTFLLRSLMNNDEFKTDFINRFSDLTNSIFKKEKIIAKIDSFKNVFLPEIERHISRWNGFNLSGWNNNIERMRDFAEQRPVKIRRHFINYFDLNGTAFIQLHTNLPNSGYIKLNKLAVTDFPWYGHYLSGVPVKIKAIPAPGYKFVEWEGDVESNSSEIEIMLAISHNLTAVFEKSDLDLGIVINEINYNSSSDFDTEDWVELYNPADTSVDLSGWIFKDEDDEHVFTIPSGRVISADNYLVLCRDTLLFTEKYSSVDNFTGDLNFGLSSGGELIRLFNPSGKIIDSLTYDNNSPWPEEPDGNGHSLSLKNPWLDNAKPESWEASIGYGTPGEINDIFTEIKESAVPVDFMLYQNYPNPFNPVTTIRFSNPKNQHVRLEVFNVLGQSIAVIVDAQLLPGTYNYKFDGTEFSSGIYFARLSSKGKNIVNKMMLLK